MLSPLPFVLSFSFFYLFLELSDSIFIPVVKIKSVYFVLQFFLVLDKLLEHVDFPRHGFHPLACL